MVNRGWGVSPRKQRTKEDNATTATRLALWAYKTWQGGIGIEWHISIALDHFSGPHDGWKDVVNIRSGSSEQQQFPSYIHRNFRLVCFGLDEKKVRVSQSLVKQVYFDWINLSGLKEPGLSVRVKGRWNHEGNNNNNHSFQPTSLIAQVCRTRDKSTKSFLQRYTPRGTMKPEYLHQARWCPRLDVLSAEYMYFRQAARLVTYVVIATLLWQEHPVQDTAVSPPNYDLHRVTSFANKFSESSPNSMSEADIQSPLEPRFFLIIFSCAKEKSVHSCPWWSSSPSLVLVQLTMVNSYQMSRC